MPTDLDADPALAIELCRASHARLVATVERIAHEQVRSPSRLPGWTIAHVLTHLARNADGHVRRLEGAFRGEDVPRYPGGSAQRNGDIEEGARRSAVDILADLNTAQRRLELVWDRSVAAGWPHAELRGDDRWPTTEGPCGDCERSRCTTSISAWATSRPTGRKTTLRGSCPCSWPRRQPVCTELTMCAPWWLGCRAVGQCRLRSSSIRGDGCTDQLLADERTTAAVTPYSAVQRRAVC